MTSAPIVASSFSPSGPWSSSVWMRTTVCSTPNSLARSEASRLTSSFWVTPAEQVGALDPGGTQRRGHGGAPDHHLHVEFGTDRRCDRLVLLDDDHVVALGPEALREVYQPTSPAPTITTCIDPACPIGPPDHERQAATETDVTSAARGARAAECLRRSRVGEIVTGGNPPRSTYSLCRLDR